MDNATLVLNPVDFVVVKVMGINPPGATLAFVPDSGSVKAEGGAMLRVNAPDGTNCNSTFVQNEFKHL